MNCSSKVSLGLLGACFVVFIDIQNLFVSAGKNQEDWLHAEDSLNEGIHFYVKVCY